MSPEEREAWKIAADAWFLSLAGSEENLKRINESYRTGELRPMSFDWMREALKP